MTEKQTTISGKPVGMAYCFATEIGFNRMTGVNIEDFDAKNSEHVIYFVLAAIMAYYQSRGEESPVAADDLIYKASPTDIINAMKAAVELRSEWYALPFEDDAPKEDDAKNG